MEASKNNWYDWHWRNNSPSVKDVMEAKQKIIQVFLKKGQVYQLIGKWEQAKASYKVTLKLAHEIKNVSEIGQASHFLGHLAKNTGDINTSLTYYQKALACFQEINNSESIASSLGAIGTLYRYKGDFGSAMDYLERSLKIFQDLNNRKGIATLNSNIGIIYAIKGDNESAKKIFNQLLQLGRELKDKQLIASALGNIGGIFRQEGAYRDALDYYQKMLTISQEIGDKRLIAAATANTGFIYYDIGKFVIAMEYFERYLKINQELHDKQGVGVALGNMGNVYIRLGQDVVGVEYLDKAITMHRKIGFIYGLTYWLKSKARLLFNKGYFAEAKKAADECMELSSKISNIDTLFEIKLLLAKIDYALGKRKEAIEKIEVMLFETQNDEEKAESHYALYQLGVNLSRNKKAAIKLYQKLYKLRTIFDYKIRLMELNDTLSSKKNGK